MPLHALTLTVPQALVEAVSQALAHELEALAVSVADADEGTAAERALFGEPGLPTPLAGWARSQLTALFGAAAAAEEAAALLLAQDWTVGLAVQRIAAVAEQDWVRLTQSQFAPVAVTPTFWIVPSWHAPPAQAERVLRLDPGMAFGTGTHPTTLMCLRWIAAHAPADGWARVLDYGCGSGILALGAALHGARRIDAVDIDPDAVAATRANAAANGIGLHAGLPDAAHGRYDVVLANILATPLTLLAPLLAGHLQPGGHLVLAGILERQAQPLQQAYAPWCRLDVADAMDGWILMAATA